MATPLVFIVEDDAKLSEIFSLTLQAAGYQTERVMDGAVALTRLADIVPDLVILDLHLPNVAGPDILHHIRADARLAKIRVLLVTADERLAETLEDHASLTLLKPISPEQLSVLATRLLAEGAQP
jgi:two-component system, OmpR family, phosphate regulon response regulator PhoB